MRKSDASGSITQNKAYSYYRRTPRIIVDLTFLSMNFWTTVSTPELKKRGRPDQGIKEMICSSPWAQKFNPKMILQGNHGNLSVRWSSRTVSGDTFLLLSESLRMSALYAFSTAMVCKNITTHPQCNHFMLNQRSNNQWVSFFTVELQWVLTGSIEQRRQQVFCFVFTGAFYLFIKVQYI